jgi:hypothetical protein
MAGHLRVAARARLHPHGGGEEGLQIGRHRLEACQPGGADRA